MNIELYNLLHIRIRLNCGLLHHRQSTAPCSWRAVNCCSSHASGAKGPSEGRSVVCTSRRMRAFWRDAHDAARNVDPIKLPLRTADAWMSPAPPATERLLLIMLLMLQSRTQLLIGRSCCSFHTLHYCSVNVTCVWSLNTSMYCCHLISPTGREMDLRPWNPIRLSLAEELSMFPGGRSLPEDRWDHWKWQEVARFIHPFTRTAVSNPL